MDAANPLCRFLMLAVGLLAVLGCQSDNAKPGAARGQIPQDPFAPIAPPPVPPPGSYGSVPIGPSAPVTPIAPLDPPAPSGTVTPGAAVPGSPVPLEMRGSGVVQTAGVTPSSIEAMLARSETRVKLAAIVGANNVITVQEVKESVFQQYDALQKFEGHERQVKERELYSKALRDIIERELILDEMYSKLKKANKNGVIDEIKELASGITEKQIREMKKKTNTKTDDELNRILSSSGLTLAVLRRQFERQIMAQQYVNSMLKDTSRHVGLGEIRDYYERHPDEFKTPDRVKWQHIFVSFTSPPNAPPPQDRMEAIRLRVAAGEDFAALALKFDEGFAKNQKGFGTGERRSGSSQNREDWIQPLDLEPTVWALKPGQISGVIQTTTGYHLVKVVEREYAGVRPFDAKLQGEIREKMNRSIFEVDRAKLVEDLWRNGVVRVIDE